MDEERQSGEGDKEQQRGDGEEEQQKGDGDQQREDSDKDHQRGDDDDDTYTREQAQILLQLATILHDTYWKSPKGRRYFS